MRWPSRPPGRGRASSWRLARLERMFLGGRVRSPDVGRCAGVEDIAEVERARRPGGGGHGGQLLSGPPGGAQSRSHVIEHDSFQPALAPVPVAVGLSGGQFKLQVGGARDEVVVSCARHQVLRNLGRLLGERRVERLGDEQDRLRPLVLVVDLLCFGYRYYRNTGIIVLR